MKLLISFILLISAAPLCLAEDYPVYSYTVKGIIRQLPEGKGARRSPLMIKHQEIKDFKDEHGRTVGMHAMTMPFSVNKDLDLSKFLAGDCVEFSFRSWWKPKPGDEIESIRKIECDF